MNRRYAIVAAPSVLGLRPTGVEHLPDALLGAELSERLGARHAGRVEPPPYDDRRDPETLLLNPARIARYTRWLADAVGDVLAEGDFPIVLGGDCSILFGSMLALRRRGRYGLLFVDGHADFYQPEANVNGEAASSDLALATGREPEIMTTFDGRRPLVRDEDVVVLGFRDAKEAAHYGSQPLPPDITAIDLAEVRAWGAEAAARRGSSTSSKALERFRIHLDADVLDDAVMAAVDYRLPGGLSWHELEVVLRTALSPGRAVGLKVTIFNPHLDHDATIAGSLVNVLASALNGIAALRSSLRPWTGVPLVKLARKELRLAQKECRLFGSGPVLPVKDIARAATYYCYELGFTLDFVYDDPPTHGSVVRDRVGVQFTRAPEGFVASGYPGWMYIFVENIDQLFDEYRGRNVRFTRELEDREHGMREFEILDVDEHRLRFGQYLSGR